MKGRWLHEVIIFTKIISSGFLVGGFAFMGILIARKLVQSGWPLWVNVVLPVVFTLFGLQQGWLLIKNILNRNNK